VRQIQRAPWRVIESGVQRQGVAAQNPPVVERLIALPAATTRRTRLSRLRRATCLRGQRVAASIAMAFSTLCHPPGACSSVTASIRG
jgi:hypothetical protein